jgi:hypothetical protein
MLDNFHKFWEVLSKPGVEHKKLYYQLTGNIEEAVPSKLSSSIMNYPGTVNRNILQADLKDLSETVIEDLVKTQELETEFLENYYAQSGALSQYALISKNILEARYAALFDSDTPGPAIAPAVNKNKISPELLAESLSRRPILLIGDVGVGKTTFIRKLIKIDAAPIFNNSIYIYIDLGSQGTLSRDLRDFIIEDTTTQLRKITILM